MATPAPIPHPYYPTNLPLHGYTPPAHSLFIVGAIFGAFTLLAFGGGYLLTRGINPLASRSSGLSAAWFFFCKSSYRHTLVSMLTVPVGGLLHLHFEGFFIKRRHTLAASSHLFASAWKHYTLSDSRYLANDNFVVSIEQLTVLIQGPLCLLVFTGGVFNKWWRHPLRIVVCAVHFWSCALYFATETRRGHADCRPEGVYWWGYLVGMNAPWIVVPVVLMWRSFGVIREALEKAERVDARLKRK